ncbi:MAG: DUF1993 domain-containing protein [Halioglobus sp.]|nr:DUF1993 domain-containing protein [Halioglobus sp.]
MAISLYDLCVPSYLQVLDSVGQVMQKGEQYAQDNGVDLGDIVETRLREDMLPFHFQVVSVMHHSRGAIEGAEAGLFTPPPSLELDYAGLQALVGEAATALRARSPDEVNALEGKSMLFRAGDFELPFSAENFITSFSLPNFYFHATTTYAILRMAGVPLGKMDYLGQLRAG